MTPETPEQRARNGVAAALVAYIWWGFMPVYFKVAAGVTAPEMLAHRIAWAVPFGALMIAMRRQWPDVGRAITNPATLRALVLASFFIALNWLVYIFAVQSGQIFQASLGYYINPLLYVLVGIVAFGETLRRMQVAAVVLAAIGVGVLTVSGGELPWISLVLAASFTAYGIIRKQVDVGGMPGLFIETLVLLPFAAGYLAWLIAVGRSAFTPDEPAMMGILLLAGPVTVLPLLCFALAARRLNLSTIGFLQFIAPTLQFIVGIGYGERLTTARLICFVLIWVAVALFCVDAWLRARRRAPAVARPA